MADTALSLPPEVRAAISDFLNDIQEDGEPFEVSIATEAVKRVFPGLEFSDAAIVDAIASEASTAGFDIEYNADATAKALKRRALERWDNEGGAPQGTKATNR